VRVAARTHRSAVWSKNETSSWRSSGLSREKPATGSAPALAGTPGAGGATSAAALAASAVAVRADTRASRSWCTAMSVAMMAATTSLRNAFCVLASMPLSTPARSIAANAEQQWKFSSTLVSL
jgi:hypothetical protein